MKIAICDDDILFAQELENTVKKFVSGKNQNVDLTVYTNPEVFLNSSLESYDIAFLDVLIGEVNGMDVAQKLREKNNHAVLIFVSAFAEFAPKGFEVNAFRYLLKGNLADSFPECMHKALAKASGQMQVFCLKPADGNAKMVRLNNILYFEGFGHNVLVHLLNGEYRTYDTLSNIEKQVPPLDFIRVQRSYIINVRNVIDMNFCQITLINQKTISCSRQKREETLRRFFEIQGE